MKRFSHLYRPPAYSDLAQLLALFVHLAFLDLVFLPMVLPARLEVLVAVVNSWLEVVCF